MCYIFAMKIGFLQFEPTTLDKEGNVVLINNLLSKVEADLMVLPEMCMTGYPSSEEEETIKYAEAADGPTVKAMIEIAKNKNMCILFGMPELVDGKVYNTTFAVGPLGIITKHQKTHLFMDEVEEFTPGTTKPHIFEWGGAKIGIGVCYDYMFPEFWRVMALQGAQLFCNTANFVSQYGFPMMRARSIENGVFSITCNRVGTEGEILYKGESEIVDNRGHVLEKANDYEEDFYVVDVDLSDSNEKVWNNWNDVINDRRPEMYE